MRENARPRERAVSQSSVNGGGVNPTAGDAMVLREEDTAKNQVGLAFAGQSIVVRRGHGEDGVRSLGRLFGPCLFLLFRGRGTPMPILRLP